jgi:hypothetical protein
VQSKKYTLCTSLLQHSLLHNHLTSGHSGLSGCNRAAKGHMKLPTEDGIDPTSSLANQPDSPNHGSQLDLAAEVCLSSFLI